MAIIDYELKTNLNFNKNQALNLALHEVSAFPSTPVAGQVCYKDGKAYQYNGSSWLDMATQIATDAQASTGTAEDVAINPKQYALKANIASPTFTGTPAAPTAATGTNTTQLATTAFVQTEIAAATLNAQIYKGQWDTTSQTDYSSLNSYRPIKAGWYFRCTGTGCTIDGVEYNAGDAITFNTNVASGVTITTSMIDKTDNTESSDLVKLNETQTLTNKTIDGDDNTIQDLKVTQFKSGEVLTSATSGSAKLITSGGVYTELQSKENNLTFSTGLTRTSNTITVDHPFIALSAGSIAYGASGGVVTELGAGTDGYILKMVSGYPTWSAAASGVTKETYTNPALTPDSDGICTWTVDHGLNTKDLFIDVYEVSTGANVIMTILRNAASQVTIKFYASGNVSAGTYKVVLGA
ncbi:MAG: hypothetical protein J6S85_03900 [Methanobrevibacter sp.]|nr:hypothetical protein [Methanobrevibacter sp.]MBO7712686.1 hypothetical protein [Methanobrevibacter sp.]